MTQAHKPWLELIPAEYVGQFFGLFDSREWEYTNKMWVLHVISILEFSVSEFCDPCELDHNADGDFFEVMTKIIRTYMCSVLRISLK